MLAICGPDAQMTLKLDIGLLGLAESQYLFDISFDQRCRWLKCELKDTLKRLRFSTGNTRNSKCGQGQSGKFISFHGKSKESQGILLIHLMKKEKEKKHFLGVLSCIKIALFVNLS